MNGERANNLDNSTQFYENNEQKSEYPVVDYNNYDIICNYKNDGSRRRGILSEELYGEIINDPGTIFINSGENRIPVFIGIDQGIAMGYDSNRCKEYAKDISSEIRAMALPFHELNEDEKKQTISSLLAGGGGAVYFSDHNGDESSAFAEALDKINAEHIEIPLIDERAAKGDEQAGLYLYMLSAEQNESRGERKKIGLAEAWEYYNQNIGPSYSHDGKVVTELFIGNKVDDLQAEEMWDLYNDRFEFLGDGHPISMQDSKEGFFELLRSDSTLISATFLKDEQGQNKLTCFSYFIDDINSLYWLNQNYLKEKFTVSEDSTSYMTEIFTPGIVSSGEGSSYSSLPLSLFTKACDEAGMSVSMLYENTNLSKKYIPRIVDRMVGRACKFTTLKPSKMIDQVTYRLWNVKV